MNDKALMYTIERQTQHMEDREGSLDGMNDFFVTYTKKDGNLIHKEVIDGPCLARLDYLWDEEATPEYLSVSIMKDRPAFKKTEKVAKKFLTYLANESPYSDAFVSKDPSFMLKVGAIFSVDVPANIMAGAAIAMRTLWEYTGIPLFWDELVKLGVHPDMAFLASHVITSGGGNYYVMDSGNGHRAVDVYKMGRQDFTCFLKHTPAFVSQAYKDIRKYNNVSATWLVRGAGKYFLKGYVPEKLDVRVEWGERYETRYDTSLLPFADWLKEQYADIMELPKPAKKKAPKKGNVKKIAKKKPKEHPLISLITVQNGFTLAEVREIRKNLREIIAGGTDHKNPNWKGLQGDEGNVNKDLYWAYTPQHKKELRFRGSPYWTCIHHHLKIRGVYNAAA